MKVAFYYGDHKDDGFGRVGYWFIRRGQVKEQFAHFSHCEAVFEGDHKKALIGSASVRDGNQVRVKQTGLKKGRWVVWDVPRLNTAKSKSWFYQNSGTPYSMIGAMSSAVWFVKAALSLFGVDPRSLGQWCSRSIGESVELVGAADMHVSELATVLWNLPGTVDVTKQFFDELEDNDAELA